MARKAITAKNTNAAGPYSHAVDSEGLVFLSGQLPLDHAAGKFVEGDIAVQTQQCFTNLFNVLAAGGLSPDDVVKVTVFLTDMADYGKMNEVYMKQFSAPYPARSAIGVASLPLGGRIEIELIARKP